ncbi:MAG: hypothetical protein HN769_14375, partial [Anaerolineae bacterium]|nr:hypothetical protein [Anaerolineae bacterium]
MKAYFETNKENKFRAIVVIPLKRGGEYRVMARVSGTEKSGKRVEFSFPSMWLWKADVHTFGKACAMLANWAGKQTGKKYKAGGGGHKEEINDGQIRLWNW